MIFERQSKNKKVLLVMSVLLLVAGISYITWSKFSAKPESIPGMARENNDLWKTTTDEKTGVTFQYPETLLTTYIQTVDWPPQVQVLNESFTCTEAGSETARAGKTEKRLVDNREYCRTSIVEGAAGSIYTQYAYAFPFYSTGSTQADRKTVIFTFTTRSTQCGNYNEAERKACEGERETFDLDSVVDRMAQSIVIK